MFDGGEWADQHGETDLRAEDAYTFVCRCCGVRWDLAEDCGHRYCEACADLECTDCMDENGYPF